MTETSTDTFDAIKYLDEIIEEMGMQDESPEELEELKGQMGQALHDALFQAAADNLEPEVIDRIMDEMQDEEDEWFIITQLLQNSPAAQVAMLQTLDEFKEQTLEAFNQLK